MPASQDHILHSTMKRSLKTPHGSGASGSGPTLEVSPFAEIRHPKKRAFLVALAETGTRTRAAAIAGVHRSVLYTPQWKQDRAFQAAL